MSASARSKLWRERRRLTKPETAWGGAPGMETLLQVLQRVPKAELHLHLRGAVPVEVLAALINRYSSEELWREATTEWKASFESCDNITPFLTAREWSVDDIAELFHYRSFEQFVATYAFVGYFVRTTSDLRELIRGVLDSLRAQNVVYAEITASVLKYTMNGIPLAEVLGCLEEATEHPGIEVQWILGLVRDYGAESALRLLRGVLDAGNRAFVGVTLAGSEHSYPPAMFSEVFALARDHGLRLTAHAGEASGPESIWDALRVLHVERVGHGVRAVEDEGLMEYLAAEGIPLEVCPTSNVATGVFPTYEAHPVRRLTEAEIPVTINTDDPTFFDTTLVDEYAHVLDLGVSRGGICEMVENGFRYAFLPQERIDVYLAEVRRAWESPETDSGKEDGRPK
jgi:adenosine deaminase